jgi:hypothetical protein
MATFSAPCFAGSRRAEAYQGSRAGLTGRAIPKPSGPKRHSAQGSRRIAGCVSQLQPVDCAGLGEKGPPRRVPGGPVKGNSGENGKSPERDSRPKHGQGQRDKFDDCDQLTRWLLACRANARGSRLRRARKEKGGWRTILLQASISREMMKAS